jgi:benzoyl-CoA 2,3-dioxygenase component B
MVDQATWDARRGEWLPSDADETYIKSLMKPCFERGKMASWIAPPAKGINGLPEAFEYVRL